jgi:uncharacterized spore protein YtfJ
MAEKSDFIGTVETLFKGMDTFLTTKTVVGEPVKLDDGTLVLPFVDVSFAVGAGAFSKEGKNNAGGAMSGKMSPSSALVIQDGHARLVSVKNQDVITRVIDIAPDLINRFTKGGKEKKQKEDAIDKQAVEAIK